MVFNKRSSFFLEGPASWHAHCNVQIFICTELFSHVCLFSVSLWVSISGVCFFFFFVYGIDLFSRKSEEKKQFFSEHEILDANNSWFFTFMKLTETKNYFDLYIQWHWWCKFFVLVDFFFLCVCSPRFFFSWYLQYKHTKSVP